MSKALPEACRALLLGDLPPDVAYRRAFEELAALGQPADYAATEAIVYATEIRYAIEVLRAGRPKRWHNFGDLRGDSDAKLYAILDRVAPRSLVFVGSGYYPVSAFLLEER